jgi:hypothetical protein
MPYNRDMNKRNRCKCGKAMSKASRRCKGCNLMRDLQWHGLCDVINSALSRKVLMRQTAFGPYQVSSVSYRLTGMEWTTVGDWLNTRTFVCHGGDLVEMAKALEVDARVYAFAEAG